MKTTHKARPLLSALLAGFTRAGLESDLTFIHREALIWFEVDGLRYELILGAAAWDQNVSRQDVFAVRRYRKSLSRRWGPHGMVAKGMAGHRPRRTRTVIVTRVGWTPEIAALAAPRRVTLVRIPPDHVHRAEGGHEPEPFHAHPQAVKMLVEVFPDLEADATRELRVIRRGGGRWRRVVPAAVVSERLHAICRTLPSDWEPYGTQPRNGGDDCSCGCRFFLELPGALQCDWGVCTNPHSPRAGLLTFEHQGCEEFRSGKAPRVEGGR